MIQQVFVGILYLAIITMLVRPDSQGAAMVKGVGNAVANLIQMAVSG